MTGTREVYIKYRFKRAEESFDDALIMIEKQRWNLQHSCIMMAQ
jgi:hypothetical protein